MPMPTSLQRWIDEEIYRQFTPSIRRIGKPPSHDVSVDYDIEFRWPQTFWIVYTNEDIEALDVLAHLHVRRGSAPQLGGIWVEGFTGSGRDLNEMNNRRYFRDWMLTYVE
jgi:hypothetical protein